MDFDTLLAGAAIDPRDVSLLLHKPSDRIEHHSIAAMVEEWPARFEAYQSTHPRIEEATVKRRPQAASFVMRDPGDFVCVRLYEVVGWEETSARSFARDADFVAMTRLSGWRGIYLIVDRSDAARYVGAAYGEEKMAGRRRAHVAGEIGITAELSRRRTDDFRFSGLDVIAPTAAREEVVARERHRMERLDTIEAGLNA
ncbi:hypothetical protein LX81_00114 [Palleronia aestuarii]|uniref:GIY-YIG nuclease family protein n=1 Tax=Palleronia aestuarii TaxID=568105 RepID=A0A2W7NNG0_9RHOB|nr:hypothetical protein [Palleronia aestuarii]PZX19657.1 hypothetical protein LX81_00114 [Palleronia aestuarii]